VAAGIQISGDLRAFQADSFTFFQPGLKVASSPQRWLLGRAPEHPVIKNITAMINQNQRKGLIATPLIAHVYQRAVNCQGLNQRLFGGTAREDITSFRLTL
jgi:hypothetical protein